jgi:hypothetical protein
MNMKRFLGVIAAAAMATGAIAQQQQFGNPARVGMPGGGMGIGIDPATGLPISVAELPKFNLDFPGGDPDLLVQFINEEIKRVALLNVIIPNEYRDVQIPPMKLKSVNVVQVFDALSNASMRTVAVRTDDKHFHEVVTNYSFQTTQPVTTNSIWYFTAPRQPQYSEERVCRFYQLGPYLDGGVSVNDITTAIKAAYKMLGTPDAPELNFHKETQLLIAVSVPSKLKIIDEALLQLPRGKRDAKAVELPKPMELPKPAVHP